ncbi:hypothetical protein Hypma_012385 [Hypsizygus marmoreus]|uniref:Uncharacterized protein n=1 Tax=Hypsizygus marmoreus TaxID=39966 RepID=A0A369JGY8_HYPMA|nr:hypothetical protein Hypma_012385 [Hypsizygus marmoreus]
MSISIDDLANSFSSSHIGQEAIDLAALQAQLAQTLFGQSIAQSSGTRQVTRRSSYSQPCNTPTFSSSFTLTGRDLSEAQRQNSSSSSWSLEGSSYDGRDDMEEDERMVEDLLVPRSPTSKTHYYSPHNQPTSESSSSFTSTDPFYIAQCQAQNHNTSPHSPFAQLGRPTQQSPFTSQRYQQYPAANHSSPPHLSLETHSILVSTSAAFDR